jgi:hypothetical protein
MSVATKKVSDYQMIMVEELNLATSVTMKGATVVRGLTMIVVEFLMTRSRVHTHTQLLEEPEPVRYPCQISRKCCAIEQQCEKSAFDSL